MRNVYSQYVQAHKTITPTDEELRRMADNLWGAKKGEIRDKETFDAAFNDYFLADVGSMKNEAEIRKKVFNLVFDVYGNEGKRVSKKSIFKKAGGKSFEQDKRTKAKRVVVSAEEYIRLGAQKVDLAGYDTPKRFSFVGRQRGTVKYARVISTKSGIRFIDKKGRYVSVKRK